MALYSLAQRTSAVNFAASAEYIAGANRFRVIEFSWISAVAQAAWISWGRPALAGSGPVASLFQAETPGDPASTSSGAMTWASGPTLPPQFYRRGVVGASAGSGIIWTFPRGFVVNHGRSVVLWNNSTSPAADISCVIEE